MIWKRLALPPNSLPVRPLNPIPHGPSSSVGVTGGGANLAPPLKTIEGGIFQPCDEKTKYSVGNFRPPKKFWSQSVHACMHSSPYCMHACMQIFLHRDNIYKVYINHTVRPRGFKMHTEIIRGGSRNCPGESRLNHDLICILQLSATRAIGNVRRVIKVQDQSHKLFNINKAKKKPERGHTHEWWTEINKTEF